MNDMERKEDPFKEFEKLFAQLHFEKEQNSYTFIHPKGCEVYNQLLELNNLEVDLHDVIQRNVFKGIDYYSIIDQAPIWVRDAGHSQEGNWTKDDLNKLIAKHDNVLTHKFLYYHDCEMLMNAFQNKTAVMGTMLGRVFETLTPDLKYSMPDYDNVVFSCGASSSDVYVNLNSIIIMLASSFDILTKVAYELQEMPKISYDCYPKMRSANTTFGHRGYLAKVLQDDKTIFAESTPKCIETVEALRNEIIHNGSLDFNYNLYHGAKGDIIEHWIFAPDINESGRLETIKGRKKFYSDCKNTFNTLLPNLMLEVIGYLQRTMILLIEHFDCEATDNKHEVLNYTHEIAQWRGLEIDEDGKICLPEWMKDIMEKAERREEKE